MNANLELPTAPRLQTPWSTGDRIDSGREFPSHALFKPATPLRNAGAARLHPVRQTVFAPSLRLVPPPTPTTRRIVISTAFPNVSKKDAYNAWMKFDLLPAFMRGPTDVFLPEPYENRWSFRMGDDDVRWEARTISCVPGETISWRSPEHAELPNRGWVIFSDMGRRSSQVSVNLEFDGLGAARLTPLTLKRVESQLCDTLEFLKAFLGPCALPSAMHSL